MTDKKESLAKNKLSADWLVRGVLTKIGDTFDKLTGRGWKPSSSLATSELIERLKKLLDAEVKDTGGQGRFVPHNIKLKMQWDKFSTDAEDALKKLQNELLTAAIDHINDNRYHTYAPLKVEVKPDYFTEGVKLLASFDEFGADEKEVELNVTIPQIKVGDLLPPPQTPAVEPKEETENYVAEFTADGKQKSVEIGFTRGKRLSVGRTKENGLSIDDPSISKHHATLMVNPQGKFLVADTGSTNGTFINNERIAYGRAFAVGDGDKVKFGNVEVFFRQVPKPTTFVTEEEVAAVEEEIETQVSEPPKPQPAASYVTDESRNDKSGVGGGNEIEEARTETYKTGGYETENNNAQNNGAEIETYGADRVKSRPLPTDAEDEDFTDAKNGNPEEGAPLTEQRIKLNFGDDQ